jgi:RNA polymerase sigma-70 factor (ECF subfamily)
MTRGPPRISLTDAEAREAFTAVYDATFRQVLAYCRRRTLVVQDAEDALVEVYLVAWRRVDELVLVDSKVAWLIGIAHRVLANQHRGRNRRERLFGRLLPVARQQVSPDPADIAAHNAAIALVYTTLARLPPGDQELIRLFVLEDLTYDQIGSVLRLRPPVVRTRLYRARRRLAEQLALAEGTADLNSSPGSVYPSSERRNDPAGEMEADG